MESKLTDSARTTIDETIDIEMKAAKLSNDRDVIIKKIDRIESLFTQLYSSVKTDRIVYHLDPWRFKTPDFIFIFPIYVNET